MNRTSRNPGVVASGHSSDTLSSGNSTPPPSSTETIVTRNMSDPEKKAARDLRKNNERLVSLFPEVYKRSGKVNSVHYPTTLPLFHEGHLVLRSSLTNFEKETKRDIRKTENKALKLERKIEKAENKGKNVTKLEKQLDKLDLSIIKMATPFLQGKHVTITAHYASEEDALLSLLPSKKDMKKFMTQKEYKTIKKERREIHKLLKEAVTIAHQMDVFKEKGKDYAGLRKSALNKLIEAADRKENILNYAERKVGTGEQTTRNLQTEGEVLPANRPSSTEESQPQPSPSTPAVMPSAPDYSLLYAPFTSQETSESSSSSAVYAQINRQSPVTTQQVTSESSTQVVYAQINRQS